MEKTGRWLRKNGKWMAALLCLLLFFLIAEDLAENELDRLDGVGYQTVSLLRCPPVTTFFKLFTNLAHPIALLAVSLLIVVFTGNKQYRVAVYANLILNTFLNLALKAIFLRGRPADVAHLVNETGYSFPSGHAMAATAFYGFLIFLVWQSGMRKSRKWACAVPLGLTVLLICMSRVYLGVHYTSDVLAGCAISAAYLIGFTAVVKRYLVRGETEKMERNTGKKNEGLLASFLHAFDGVKESVQTERNLMIHFSAAALVTLFGFLLKISAGEWAACVTLFGLVISAELINTAVESVVDLATDKIDPRARLAKDAAAGAVLTAAVCAAVAGAVIFLPKLLALLSSAVG